MTLAALAARNPALAAAIAAAAASLKLCSIASEALGNDGTCKVCKLWLGPPVLAFVPSNW
jgi:hypothetical protein